MAKYKEYKDQFVIAHVADLDHMLPVTTHAALLSRMLGKGLILLHISDPQFTSVDPSQAEAVLQREVQVVKDREHLTDVNYMALKGNTKEIVNAFPILLNAVVAVAMVDAAAPKRSVLHPKTFLRQYDECKVAYLTVQQPLYPGYTFSQVALTIDYKRESKEKMLWSSYFARFNHSAVHALHYDYSDEGLAYKWLSNHKFMLKFYQSLSIEFSNEVLPTKRSFIDLPALDYCAAQGYQLLIAVTTNEKDVAEWFIGTQEQRTVVNSYHIPILFINPREDVYVLCD